MIRPTLTALALLIPFTALAATPCGNGTVDAGETCDDANTVDADGCSAACAVEEGFRCDNTKAANLLVNGGFEDGATGWTTDATLSTGPFAQDGQVMVTATPNAYVNSACVSGKCFEGNAGGLVWKQTVVVTASTTYRFSAFAAVRSDGGANSKLSLRVDGTDITPVFSQNGPAPAPWVPFGATFTTGPAQTSVLLAVANAYLGGPGNGFHLDELALVREASKCALAPPEGAACGNGTVGALEGCDDANTAAADGCSPTCAVEAGFDCDNSKTANLLVNGGFEEGSTGWTSDATVSNGPFAQDGQVFVTATPNTYVNGKCVSGNCLDGNAGGVVWRQTVAVTPSTEYRFGAFAAVRTDGGGSATSKLSLRVDGADITPVFDEDGPPPAPWRPFGATFTTGAAHTSVVLEVYNAYLADPGNGFVLDELALVRAPSACTAKSSPDAGADPVTDAGSVESDAGTTQADAGTATADAGTTAPDAGTTAPGIVDADGGCGCGNASAAGVLALTLGTILLPRRRRAA